MDRRIDLHRRLVAIMSEFADVPETRVHFQPPETVRLQYPCIIYQLAGDRPLFADNLRYRDARRYTVTIIDRDPDSAIPDRVGALLYSSFDRMFPVDNLNHFIYSVYI